MYDLIAIDPGRVMGVACFLDRVCVRSFGVREWLPPASALPTKRLVVELPEIRVQGGGKGDPNLLVALAYNLGVWVGRYVQYESDPEPVRPFAWKGNVPKHIMLERIKMHILNGPTPLVENHNELDAIGLGLFALGRMGRGGV